MAVKTIVTANVIPGPNASIKDCVAGQVIGEGQLVYLDQSVSPAVVKLSSATATPATNAPSNTVYGMAMNRAQTVGQKIIVNTQDDQLQPGFAITPGATVILGATTGSIADDSDAISTWNKVVLGAGIAAGKMNFNPTSYAVIP